MPIFAFFGTRQKRDILQCLRSCLFAPLASVRGPDLRSEAEVVVRGRTWGQAH